MEEYWAFVLVRLVFPAWRPANAFLAHLHHYQAASRYIRAVQCSALRYGCTTAEGLNYASYVPLYVHPKPLGGFSISSRGT